MKKTGYDVLAEAIAKQVIIDYYNAVKNRDEKAEKEALREMIYWEKALPLPIQEIKDVVKSSLYAN